LSNARAVARGTSRLLAGLLTAKALDFVLYLVLARRLGVEEFGRYTFALSFTLLFSIIADLGLTTVFTREAAREPHRTRALLGDAFALKLGLGALTLAATTVTAFATHVPGRTSLLIALFTLAMLVNSLAMLFEQILKAGGRAGTAGLSVLAQSATAVTVGTALVLARMGALAGACAYLAAGFAHLAAAAWCSRAHWWPPAAGRPGAEPPGERVARRLAMLRESAPLAVSGVFIALYFRVDAVLLHVFRSEREVGLYGSIYRFFEAFVLLSAAYRSVLFPLMARAADGPAEALRALCRRTIRLHLAFTVGVATFFSFEARRIVTLVLGPAYAGAAPGLALLMWALPGAYMADTMLHLLAAIRRQHLGARAAMATAVFNVALNLALIPRFSLMGAAAATALSEALCFGLLLMAFRSAVPTRGVMAAAAPPLAAGALLAAGLAVTGRALPSTTMGLALSAAVALPAYALALLATRAVGPAELAVLRDLVPKGRSRPIKMAGKPADTGG
jgi:O-antigen/teichoic acid export membrane protein